MRLKSIGMEAFPETKPSGNFVMKDLQRTLADKPFPVFIVNADEGVIIYANHRVLSATNKQDVIGRPFEEVVFAPGIEQPHSPAYFRRTWYRLHTGTVQHGGNTCLKLSLKKRSNVPGQSDLRTLKNMIAVMLHRLRSPLTGMQGYLEMMHEDIDSDINLKRFSLVNDGIEQLFDIMDELEALHEVPFEKNDSQKISSVNPEVVLRSILLQFPAAIRQRIKVNKPGETEYFLCHPVNLKKILSILLVNAAEHTSGNSDDIVVDIVSSRTIKVTNRGNPIPDSITRRLFFPFVTSKANNLGIGLTRACILAHQYRGAVFLEENSAEKGISFTFRLPPF